MRFMLAAVVALTFACSANAAQVDYFNKTHPLVASKIGAGKFSSGGGGGSGKITAHCPPGAKGKACHRP